MSKTFRKHFKENSTENPQPKRGTSKDYDIKLTI